MPKEKIYEILIRKVNSLPESARREVYQKLEAMKEPFNFRGYAKIVYTHSSPLRVASVDPIEGNIVTYFSEIASQCR